MKLWHIRCLDNLLKFEKSHSNLFMKNFLVKMFQKSSIKKIYLKIGFFLLIKICVNTARLIMFWRFFWNTLAHSLSLICNNWLTSIKTLNIYIIRNGWQGTERKRRVDEKETRSYQERYFYCIIETVKRFSK